MSDSTQIPPIIIDFWRGDGYDERWKYLQDYYTGVSGAAVTPMTISLPSEHGGLLTYTLQATQSTILMRQEFPTTLKEPVRNGA